MNTSAQNRLSLHTIDKHGLLKRLASRGEELLDWWPALCCLFVLCTFIFWGENTGIFFFSLAWSVFFVSSYIQAAENTVNWFCLALIFFHAAFMTLFGMRLVWGPNLSVDHPLVDFDYAFMGWMLSRSVLVAFVVTLITALISREELLLQPQRRSREHRDMGLGSLIQLIQGAIGAACLFLWSIIGLVFWILLLARATNLLLVAVLHDSFIRVGNWTGDAQRGLDIASSFYVNGFIRIIDTVREQWGEHWEPQPSREYSEIQGDVPGLFVSAICVAVGGVCLLLWTIIGLVVWIPLMGRTTILFLAAVWHHSLTGIDNGVERAQGGLDVAEALYFNGFIRITEALRRRRVVDPSEQGDPIAWGRMALEVLWAVATWSATLEAFGWLSGS